MPDIFDLNLPQSIKDKFADGIQLTTEEALALENLVNKYLM
jgi:hypothetical protein